MERISKGRLFQTVGPVKETDLSPKFCLFVAGTRSVKLSQAEARDTHYSTALPDYFCWMKLKTTERGYPRICLQLYVTRPIFML